MVFRKYEASLLAIMEQNGTVELPWAFRIDFES